MKRLPLLLGLTAFLTLTASTMTFAQDDDLIAPLVTPPVDSGDDLIGPLPTGNDGDDLIGPLVITEATLRSEYVEPILGLLHGAAANDAALNKALHHFTDWRAAVRSKQLDAKFKAQIFEGWTSLAKGVEASVQRSFTKCLAGESVQLRNMLKWLTWIDRNASLAPYFAGKLDVMKANAEKCGTFELEFTSSIRHWDGQFDRIRGVTTLQVYSAAPRPRPIAVFDVQHLEHRSGTDTDCTYENLSFQGYAMAVVDVQLGTHVNRPAPGHLDPVLMFIAPHLEVEKRETCPTVEGSNDSWYDAWFFDELHENEKVEFFGLSGAGFDRSGGAAQGFAITDFQGEAGGHVRKEYKRSVGDENSGVSIEDTVFLLRHKPMR